MSERDNSDDDREISVVILDFFPHGRAGDDRPQYQKSPLAYAVGVQNFGLYELTVEENADMSIGDEIPVDSPDEESPISNTYETDYESLSSNAQSELEYAIEDIIDANERRFVDFYNDAQPITLRLHQLNLLPGIGEKLRNNILDERKRKPFETFDELTERISGLHDPKELLRKRIIEEIQEEDTKYSIFVT